MRVAGLVAIIGIAPYVLLAGNMLRFDDPVRLLWFPIGTTIALALAVWGFARPNAWLVATSIAILLAIGFPLTISATLFIAAIPAIVAAAARSAGLAPTLPTVGVGIAAAAGALAILLLAVTSGRIVTAAVVLVGLAYPAQLAACAALCLWPTRGAGTPKWTSRHRAT